MSACSESVPTYLAVALTVFLTAASVGFVLFGVAVWRDR